MQGPELNRSIQYDIAGSKVRDNTAVDKRPPERQAKLAELKDLIQSGNYKVDTQTLARRIHEAGVLADE